MKIAIQKDLIFIDVDVDLYEEVLNCSANGKHTIEELIMEFA